MSIGDSDDSLFIICICIHIHIQTIMKIILVKSFDIIPWVTQSFPVFQHHWVLAPSATRISNLSLCPSSAITHDHEPMIFHKEQQYRGCFILRNQEYKSYTYQPVCISVCTHNYAYIYVCNILCTH